MRISDWSSDVCSSDLRRLGREPADAAALCGTGDRRGPRHSGQRAAAADREPDRRLEAETSMTQSAVSVRGVTPHFTAEDRTSVGSGKSVSVLVDLGGRRIMKQTNKQNQKNQV